MIICQSLKLSKNHSKNGSTRLALTLVENQFILRMKQSLKSSIVVLPFMINPRVFTFLITCPIYVFKVELNLNLYTKMQLYLLQKKDGQQHTRKTNLNVMMMIHLIHHMATLGLHLLQLIWSIHKVQCLKLTLSVFVNS